MRLVVVAIAALLLSAPSMVRADSSRKVVTVAWQPGTADTSGYEYATIDVAYWFLICDGNKVTVQFAVQPHTLNVRQWYRFGAIRHLLGGAKPPRITSVEVSGTVQGAVVKPFNAGKLTVGTYRCTGNSAFVGFKQDLLGDKPTKDDVERLLEGLSVEVNRASDTLTNPSLESELRAQERKERLAKEKAEKEKVAADKEKADKEAADKEKADKEAADKAVADKEKADKDATDKDKADKDKADKDKADRPSTKGTITVTSSDEGSSSSNNPYPNDSVADSVARGEHGGVSPGRSQQQPVTVNGGQTIADYQASERAKEARIGAAATEMGGLVGGMLSNRAAINAQNAENRRQNAIYWNDRCAKRALIPVAETGYAMVKGTTFNEDSANCRGGQFVESNYLLADDHYTLEVTATKRLRFVLGGHDDEVILKLWLNGAEQLWMGGKRDFSANLRPGRYTISVEQTMSWHETEPYFLRVLADDACWTESATPIGASTYGTWSEMTCRGENNRKAKLYRIDPTTKEQRKLRISLLSVDAAPVMTVLAGPELRRLAVPYSTSRDEASVVISSAAPEPYYVLVSSGANGGQPNYKLDVDTEVLPYESRFRGEFRTGLGGNYQTGGRGGITFNLNIGFSLGAQIRRQFGVSAVASAEIGFGIDRNNDGAGPYLFLSAFAGPGFHYGTPYQFIRVTPGISILSFSETTTGVAVRVDGTLPFSDRTGLWGLQPFIELHAHDTPSVNFGFAFATGPRRHIPAPNDR